ncbi:hypothetical protein [Microbacterium aurantiacum]|uniref:hypothetical protein n=1 Tax=Microbacterium aurantiacum TaxID=162393 RepID=UPI000C7F815F|nr:hypothetical protein [Microbacterium aurantiacum]
MTENAPRPSRRTVLRGAAWSVPLIAAAAATPLAAASTVTDVGAFRLVGSCGVLGLLGPGFTLTAGDQPLPVGTGIVINGSGVADIGDFSASGGTAVVTVLSGTSRSVTLTAPLPAGATVALRTTLSIEVAFTMEATASLPAGYAAGAGAKPTGAVSSSLILCSAS